MKILKDKKVLAVIILANLLISSLGSFAQIKTLQTEKDGFSWYELMQGSLVDNNTTFGAQSVNGTTLIPLSRGYKYICYHSTSGGWFCVKKNGKEGACDKNGKEIVAPGRYDKVHYRGDDGYVEVISNGKVGACDMDGREIIAPRYESLIYSRGVFRYEDASGNWVSTGVSLDGSSSYVSNNSSSSSSSPSSSSASSSGQSKLLYEGNYTEGKWIGRTTGWVMDPTFPQQHFAIYENYLESVLGRATYEGKTSDGRRKYSISGLSDQTYYVDDNFNITAVAYMSGFGTTEAYNISYTKGNASYNVNVPAQSGNNGGSYNNGGGTSNSSGSMQQGHGTREVTITCPVCHSTGNCQTCLGRGWRTLTDNSTQKCPTCNGNKVCWKCNGTGKITKTERY